MHECAHAHTHTHTHTHTLCRSFFNSLLLFSRSVTSHSLRPQGLQHPRLLCPSPSPGVCSNSCPLGQWCHPAVSSSVVLFSCLQSLPASGSFLTSWLFASGGQNIGASASVSVLPMNIQAWFPLGLTGLISLLAKGLPRVFFSTTVLRHLSIVQSSVNFWGTARLFSKVVLFYIPINNAESSHFSTSFCQILLFSIWLSGLFVFLKIVDILMGMKWYLIIILICMALMSSDIVQLFMCLKTIYISSLKKYLILFSQDWLVNWLNSHFLLFNSLCINILGTRPLSDIKIVSIPPILWVGFSISW